ncbi:hypothetical protein F5B20DRAFT_209944 [Whalleya microplaca]|nr:hypothetical protein F5B20DRAFT_209944 [Whalleya microplaca]
MNTARCSPSLRVAVPTSHIARPLRRPLPVPSLGLQRQPRTQQQQPGTRRSIHLQPAVAALVQGSQDAILGLHHLAHTPWFLTIPLVALGIHAVFRLPFHAHQQRLRARRARFGAVLRAWAARIQRDLEREKSVPDAGARLRETRARYLRAEKRIWRTAGLQGWKLYSSLLGVPFWILGIDSVRRLCGGPKGLLGAFLTGSADDAAASAEVGGGDAAASASSQGPVAVAAGGDVSAVDSAASAVTERISQLADPSIATGGCLWFPDLSVPDPYHILPFALSAMMVSSMLLKPGSGAWALGPGPDDKDKEKVTTRSSRITTGFRRGGLLVAGLIGPLTIDLPAAIHLYWLTSTAANLVTYKVLDRLVPLEKKTYERCKGHELPVIRPKRPEDAVPTKPPTKAKKGTR